MSRRRKHIYNNQPKTDNKSDFLKSLTNLSLDELQVLNNTVPIALKSKVQSAFNSDDPQEIMKANLYLGEISKNDNKIHSIFFDPNDLTGNGKGFKSSKGFLPFQVLRRMGDIWIVRAVVNTRVEQIQNFLHFSEDEQKEGFTIRKKKGLFAEDPKNLSRNEKKKIEGMVDFLDKGGFTEKWDNIDSFQEFIRKIVFDSLTLDQLAFEIVRNKNWEMQKFRAIDASTIRFLDSIDPRQRALLEDYRFAGYLPRFCMVWDDMIIRNPVTKEAILYYPWELGFGIRNKNSNILKNEYGTSELETLVEIITGLLNGMQYNQNNFSVASMPKGFINVKNANMSNSTLDEFRQAWQQTMTGVANAKRTPIIRGLDLEWIDLDKSNREMEFNEWIKFLIVLTCAVYRIDPTELGFQFKDQAQIFGQDGQRERLQHSKDKGLKPLLIFLQNIITKYLISEIDEEYEFVFTGIDVEDENAQVDLDSKKLQFGMVSMEDMFKKYSGRDFDPEKDTILNQVYQQAAAAKQQQEQFGSSMPGEMEEEGVETEEEKIENPFDKSADNPILAQALDYYQRNLYK